MVTQVLVLFTALECFINHILPENELYVQILPQKEERYNKIQIQRNINFNDKMKKVLPKLLKKNFFEKPNPTNQFIENLKNLRDEIVHTKSEQSSKNQEELIKKVLNFRYDETFDAVAKFMNFYKKDYLTECNCGLNY